MKGVYCTADPAVICGNIATCSGNVTIVAARSSATTSKSKRNRNSLDVGYEKKSLHQVGTIVTIIVLFCARIRIQHRFRFFPALKPLCSSSHCSLLVAYPFHLPTKCKRKSSLRFSKLPTPTPPLQRIPIPLLMPLPMPLPAAYAH